MREFRKATASALERNKIRLKDALNAGENTSTTSSSLKKHDDDDDVGDDGEEGDDEGSITAGMTDEYDSFSDAGSYTDGHSVAGTRIKHSLATHPINTHSLATHPINTHPSNTHPITLLI